MTDSHPQLALLEPFVGSWTIGLTHPMYEGVVSGRSEFAWLAGRRFLINRAESDHPDFPDSISIIGVAPEDEDGLSAHYYDSRGVFRVYRVEVEDGVLRMWRDHPGFSQRFTGRLEDGGGTIAGQWQLSRDDATWDDDLGITYRRAP